MLLKKIYKKIIPEQFRIYIRLQIHKLLSIFFIGNKYYCNCCNKSFRKFRTYGFEKRENACCPYCHSLERERLLKFYFEDYLSKTNNQNFKILHFAPERSLEKLFKSFSNIEYFGADINPLLADYVVDITSIPFENESFDIVICSHVLAHIEDEKKAIKELYRVLNNSGFLIILTHLNPELEFTIDKSSNSFKENTKYIQNDPVFRYHGLDFTSYLSNFNFQVEEYNYKDTFSEYKIQKFCLGNGRREMFYLCRKK